MRAADLQEQLAAGGFPVDAGDELLMSGREVVEARLYGSSPAAAV
jgi:hypothetical protein